MNVFMYYNNVNDTVDLRSFLKIETITYNTTDIHCSYSLKFL